MMPSACWLPKKKSNLALCMLAVIGFTSHSTSSVAEEVSLLNSSGEAVAYVDTSDELTIYMWSGEPVAYFYENHIYGFNGKHLGWFERGAIFTQDGTAACATREAFSGHAKYESYKGYKKYKPYKAYREYAPYMPHLANSFGVITCSLLLGMGSR